MPKLAPIPPFNPNMTREEREALEDKAYALPRVADKHIGMDILQMMPAQDLYNLVYGKIIERRAQCRKPKRAIRRPHKIGETFIEEDGRVIRVERWEHYTEDDRPWESEVRVPMGRQISWECKRVSASLVLHWIRTGEKLPRLRRKPGPAKPFKAVLRIDGKPTHLGYYATQEERDTVVGLARLGVFPKLPRSK